MIERVYIHKNRSKDEELAVKQVTKYKYVVHNKSKNTVYIVDVIYTYKIRWFSCVCKSYQYNHRCKHIDAVKQYIDDEELEAKINSIKENTKELMCID